MKRRGEIENYKYLGILKAYTVTPPPKKRMTAQFRKYFSRELIEETKFSSGKMKE